jgi:hypothetical protein
VEAQTGEPPALFGLEVDAAIEWVESMGLGWSLTRSDDPRGARPGSDVVLAARYSDGGGVELVVGSTLPRLEAGA